jgi:HK97 family phage major capsid protein
LRQVETSVEMRGKATEYLRFAIAKAVTGTQGDMNAAEYFKSRWPRSQHIEIFTKAAVAAGTTSGATWAGPLAELSQHSAALIEMLRPLTIIGRMQGFRRVPFQVKFPRVTAGSSVRWIGAGKAKPLSRLSLDQIEFPHSKICGIVVYTRELARHSDPSVEALVRQDMVAAISQFSDQAFLDPAIAEVDGQSPASITNGATEITSTGATAAAVEADLTSLFAAVTTNLTAPYLIMRRATAIGLAQLRTTAGDRCFPDVGAMGGSIWGVPVITSENTPADTNSPTNYLIILIDAAEILLAEGDIEFSVATHTALQMDDAPDSPPTANTVLVGLWQHNLVGVGIDRYVYWQRRREGSVAYISGVPF